MIYERIAPIPIDQTHPQLCVDEFRNSFETSHCRGHKEVPFIARNKPLQATYQIIVLVEVSRQKWNTENPTRLQGVLGEKQMGDVGRT